MTAKKPKKIPPKWIKLAAELFQFFKLKMAENGYEVKEAVHPIFIPESLHQMHKLGTYEEDIEHMLEFAIKNWDRLHSVKGLHNFLTPEPGFNLILSQFKYPIIMHLSKAGFEGVEVVSQEETKKPNLNDISKSLKTITL